MEGTCIIAGDFRIECVEEHFACIKSNVSVNPKEVTDFEAVVVTVFLHIFKSFSAFFADLKIFVCSVAKEDAGAIAPDMWGWLTYGGEPAGFAKIAEIGAETVEPATGLTYVSVSLHPEQHLDIPEGAAVDAELFIAGSDDVEPLPVEAITERGKVWWITDNRCTEIPANVVLTDEILAWVELPEGLPVAVGEYKEGMCVQEAEE